MYFVKDAIQRNVLIGHTFHAHCHSWMMGAYVSRDVTTSELALV
jgi:hypothetical protein